MKKMYMRVVAAAIIALIMATFCSACGSSLSKDEQLIYDLCERYKEDLLRPETFRVYSAARYHTDEEDTEYYEVWRDGYYVSFGAEDRGGDMQKGVLVINTETTEWMRYDNLYTLNSDGSKPSGMTQEDIDLYYGTLGLFLYGYEREDLSRESIKKINDKLNE